MKRIPLLLVASVCVLALSACGDSTDKPKLAQQTVVTYWADIGRAKFPAAYGMLTSGVRASLKPTAFEQAMFSLVQKTQGVWATAGKPDINGDRAVVPIGLHAASAPGGTYHVYQHLFWEDGAWKISEPLGGWTTTK